MVEKASPQPFDWEAFAERLLQKADVYERHQRLGHFHRINGLQTATDLRDFARQIKEKSFPIKPRYSSEPEQ